MTRPQIAGLGRALLGIAASLLFVLTLEALFWFAISHQTMDASGIYDPGKLPKYSGIFWYSLLPVTCVAFGLYVLIVAFFAGLLNPYAARTVISVGTIVGAVIAIAFVAWSSFPEDSLSLTMFRGAILVPVIATGSALTCLAFCVVAGLPWHARIPADD